MHINITTSETGNNKGSSGQLVSYLEKENRQIQNLKIDLEYWFNAQTTCSQVAMKQRSGVLCFTA